jgi:hypothetical protein
VTAALPCREVKVRTLCPGDLVFSQSYWMLVLAVEHLTTAVDRTLVTVMANAEGSLIYLENLDCDTGELFADNESWHLLEAPPDTGISPASRGLSGPRTERAR